jgi:hypothetical protein
MTNEQIIANSAVAAGIFTQEEAEAYFSHGMRLPIHTFAEWKSCGYMVKKGEHAALTVSIWKPKTRKRKKDEKNVEADKEENSGFFLTTAYLFTKNQVEAIKTA